MAYANPISPPLPLRGQTSHCHGSSHQRPDGLLVYKLKTPYRDGTEYLLFSPEEFLEKLALLILFIAFFMILLTENSRIPIDDPATHLELTMIHYTASIKLFLFMALTASILWPPTGTDPLKAVLWLILEGEEFKLPNNDPGYQITKALLMQIAPKQAVLESP